MSETRSAWIMQIQGNPKSPKYQFDLQGSLKESLKRDRTLWLANFQYGREIRAGDRLYLVASGVKGATTGTVGVLVAVARIVEAPQPHGQHEWQSEFRAPESAASYDANTERIKLFVEALVEPPLERSEIKSSLPDPTKTMFYATEYMKTMAPVEEELDQVLKRLLQDHLVQVDVGEASKTSNPDDEDTRRKVLRELYARDGQAALRKRLELTREVRCAFTGTSVGACLQAAHIKPYTGDHSNRPSNALLLRADVHLLFDKHLIRITPGTMRLEVHPTLLSSEYSILQDRVVLEAEKLDEESIRWRSLQIAAEI